MQRERQTTVPSYTSTYTGTGYGSNPSTSGTHTIPSYEDFYELFDEGGSPRSRRIDNYCYHRKHYRFKPTGFNDYPDGSGTTNYTKWHQVDADLIWRHPNHHSSPNKCFGDDGLGTVGHANSVDLWNSRFGKPFDEFDTSALQSAALAALLPRIKAEMSVFNTLYELKDFKRLPDLLKRTVSLLRTLPSSLRLVSNARGRKRNTLKHITGLSAEHYLNYSFNLRPLLSEVSLLQGALARVNEVMSKLLQEELKVHRKYFTREVPGLTVNDTSFSNINSSFLAGTRWTRSVLAHKPLTFNVVLEYSYQIPAFYKRDLHQRIFMDQFGIQWNPAIIWNAIPWSFVIDWVFGVSRWLDQFKETNVKIVTAIHRACMSLKYDREVLCYTQSGLNTTAPFVGPIILCRTFREVVYERRPFVPNLYEALTSSGLNLKEFSYISALALTRLKKKRLFYLK